MNPLELVALPIVRKALRERPAREPDADAAAARCSSAGAGRHRAALRGAVRAVRLPGRPAGLGARRAAGVRWTPSASFRPLGLPRAEPWLESAVRVKFVIDRGVGEGVNENE